MSDASLLTISSPTLSTTTIHSFSTVQYLSLTTQPSFTWSVHGITTTYPPQTLTSTYATVVSSQEYTLVIPSGPGATAVASLSFENHRAVATYTGPADFLSPSSTSITTPASSSAGSTATPSPNPSATPTRLHAGAIVGIAIGSLIGLILLVLVLFYLLRARRRIRELSQAQNNPQEFEKAELPVPADASTWKDRLFVKLGHAHKPSEIAAVDEAGVRAELEWTVVEPVELAGGGVKSGIKAGLEWPCDLGELSNKLVERKVGEKFNETCEFEEESRTRP